MQSCMITQVIALVASPALYVAFQLDIWLSEQLVQKWVTATHSLMTFKAKCRFFKLKFSNMQAVVDQRIFNGDIQLQEFM